MCDSYSRMLQWIHSYSNSVAVVSVDVTVAMLVDKDKTSWKILQRLQLTRALKGFFLRVQTYVLVDVNQPLPWFFTRCPEQILSSSLEHSEEHARV